MGPGRLVCARERFCRTLLSGVRDCLCPAYRAAVLKYAGAESPQRTRRSVSIHTLFFAYYEKRGMKTLWRKREHSERRKAGGRWRGSRESQIKSGRGRESITVASLPTPDGIFNAARDKKPIRSSNAVRLRNETRDDAQHPRILIYIYIHRYIYTYTYICVI